MQKFGSHLKSRCLAGMNSENYCQKNEVLLKEVEKSYGEKPLSEKPWATFLIFKKLMVTLL